MNSVPQENRLIVIGASAGGPQALRILLSHLNSTLPAAVLVVQHSAPSGPRSLDQLLQGASRLPVAYATDGDVLEEGRVFIAPPDHHLVVYDEELLVSYGPRANRARPSIDVLFRSAAVAGTTRTIGVLLSGLLDDGAQGLAAIKRCGGVVVVQDPQDALYPQIIRNAMKAVEPDYCLPLSEIGPLLNDLAGETFPQSAPVPEELIQEVALSISASSNREQRLTMGTPSEFSCPDCGGRLWQTSGGYFKHYMCEVGHAFSQTSLIEAQNLEVERALYVALRTLEERTRMLEGMLAEEQDRGGAGISTSLQDRLLEARESAAIIRRLLLERRSSEKGS